MDYAFFSFEERTPRVDAFLKEMTDKGASIAVATFGEEGSVAFDGKEYYTCPVSYTHLDVYKRQQSMAKTCCLRYLIFP